MSGTSAGTGQPTSFQCSQCRKNNLSFRGIYSERTGYDATLTGRKRYANMHGNAGVRNSTHKREYTCDHCGHVGWSRHIDLEDQEKRNESKTDQERKR